MNYTKNADLDNFDEFDTKRRKPKFYVFVFFDFVGPQKVPLELDFLTSRTSSIYENSVHSCS